ncbi:MAG: SUMF1/EgtB/PvdO family nonheme iron enzyme [Candidatus Omnitrophica bacterium]|nr:SUMF1/EgtB/PvdO family nonheme iron enzyme [Candidatus Omnitrophota bacterium]
MEELKFIYYIKLLLKILFILFILLIVFFIFFQINQNKIEWSHVSDHTEFKPRDGHGVVVFNDAMWLLGGWRGSDEGACSEVWRSYDGISWELIQKNAPWPARHSAGFFVFNNRIWVVSGDGHADVWNSQDGISWSLITDSAPWGMRYSPYVGVHDGKIWLMGGLSWWDQDGGMNFLDGTKAFNDVWSSTDGKHWKLVNMQAPWAHRGLIHGFVSLNNYIYILGGGTKGRNNDCDAGSETFTEYNDVWRSKDGVDWQLVVPNAPWFPRTHFSVAVYDKRIWVSDGSHVVQLNLLNDVWWSKDGQDWEKVVDPPWEARHASALVSYKGYLWMIAGYLHNDVWKLSIQRDTVGTNETIATSTTKHEEIKIFSGLDAIESRTDLISGLPMETKSKATGMEMVLVPAGEFSMGSNNGASDEKPVHQVYVDAFYIDKYEITNAEYEKFDPSHRLQRQKFSDQDNQPVVRVSWFEVIKYCNWRSRQEGLKEVYNENTGEADFGLSGYRLPTEAEWEKAARGKDGRKYPWGNEVPDAGGRYRANYDPGFKAAADGFEFTASVGSYENGKSPYGLYDMAGNVWEWVNDWYAENYYQQRPDRNPKGPLIGSGRVMRGGSWNYYDDPLLVANRGWHFPVLDNFKIGFRCVRAL